MFNVDFFFSPKISQAFYVVWTLSIFYLRIQKQLARTLCSLSKITSVR